MGITVFQESTISQSEWSPPPVQLEPTVARKAEFVIYDYAIEEGFRDAKWYLGFKQARIACIQAWSRLFALFTIALLVLTTLATHLLLHGRDGQLLLRGVVSRRRNRCELSLITIMVSLLHQE